jgi:hypothetical protein
MKEFRKNEQGFFICEECGIICKCKKNLSKHITFKHDGVKNYYNKWIKDKNDGKCKICRKKTKQLNTLCGYKNCCSVQCTNKYMFIQTQKGCIKKYGFLTNFGTTYFMKKSKETFIEKYDVEIPSQLEEIKKQKEETCLKIMV